MAKHQQVAGDMAQHGIEVVKVTAGGVVTAATTYVTLSLADLIQYATLGAAVATMFYYSTVAVIAILKYINTHKITKTHKR